MSRLHLVFVFATLLAFHWCVSFSVAEYTQMVLSPSANASVNATEIGQVAAGKCTTTISLDFGSNWVTRGAATLATQLVLSKNEQPGKNVVVANGAFYNKPIFWTSGFSLQFSYKLDFSGSNTEGLALVLMPSKGTLSPPQFSSNPLARGLGYESLSPNGGIAVQIDFWQDVDIGDLAPASASVHTQYAQSNTANATARIFTQSPIQGFTPVSDTQDVTVDYFANNSTMRVCVQTSYCSNSVLSPDLIAKSFNNPEAPLDNYAYLGFTTTNSYDHYGGVKITNVAIATVQMDPTHSSLTGSFSSPIQATNSSVPAGTTVFTANDGCSNRLATSFAPTFSGSISSGPGAGALPLPITTVDGFNGTYDLRWSFTQPGSWYLNIFCNNTAIKGSPFFIQITPGPFNATRSFTTIQPPMEPAIHVNTPYVHNISFQDSFGNPVVGPSQVRLGFGWSVDGTTPNILIDGKYNVTFPVVSSKARLPDPANYVLSIYHPASGSLGSTTYTIAATQSVVSFSYGTFNSTIIANDNPTATVSVTMKDAVGGSVLSIPEGYMSVQIFFWKTEFPNPDPYFSSLAKFNQSITTGRLSVPGTDHVPAYIPYVNGAPVAGVMNLSIFTTDQVAPIQTFTLTVKPAQTENAETHGSVPNSYASSEFTVTIGIYIRDKFGNFLIQGPTPPLSALFQRQGNTVSVLCDGNISPSSDGKKLICTWNKLEGRYDVSLQASKPGNDYSVQLLGYKAFGLPTYLTFLAGLCLDTSSCLTFSNIPASVTAGSLLSFSFTIRDLDTNYFKGDIGSFLIEDQDGGTGSVTAWTGTTKYTSLSLYFQGFPSLTNLQNGTYVFSWLTKASVSVTKMMTLTPSFDGTPVSPILFTLVPPFDTFCYLCTNYTGLPSGSVTAGSPISFSMQFWTTKGAPYNGVTLAAISFPAASQAYGFVPTCASTNAKNVIVCTFPTKSDTSTMIVKLQPIYAGQYSLTPVPDISIKALPPASVVCLTCSTYTGVPQTAKQGETISFFINLFNSSANGAPLSFLPSSLNLTVDLNPKYYSTPQTFQFPPNQYKIQTTFIVDKLLADPTLVSFQVKIDGQNTHSTTSVALTKGNDSTGPSICLSCTEYFGSDGSSPISKDVAAGSRITFILKLHDSSPNPLGTLLPLSNITFTYPNATVAKIDVELSKGTNDYTVTVIFKELPPGESTASVNIIPMLNGEAANAIAIVLQPPTFCPSCTKYVKQASSVVLAGDSYKFALLLYSAPDVPMDAYLSPDNITLAASTDILNVVVTKRDNVQTGINLRGVVRANAAVQSGYDVVVTFNTPSSARPISLMPMINGVSTTLPIPITLRPPVPAADQPDPCVDIDPRVTCPDYSRQCVSTVVHYPERNGGKNYTVECRDILRIRGVIPTTTWSNVSTDVTITLQYDLPTNLRLVLNGHDVLSLKPSATDTRRFTFTLLPAAEYNYTILHNQTVGLRVNFSLSATVDSLSYSLSDVPSPGLTLLPTPCVSVGTYWIPETDACLPCPSNAYCPGGVYIYPLPGYYSTSNNDPTITKCLVADACNGFSPEAAGETEFSAGDQCNTDAGYQGNLCSDCDSNHYKQELVCRSCGLDDAAQKQLILVLIVALIVFAVMAAGVAFVKDEKLAIYITIIVFIQQCSFVGSIGSSKLQSGGLAAFFQFLSLLNFEIAYFKLGCTVPQITYVKVFWATILMMVVAAVMLMVASGLFAYTRSTEYLRLKSASRSKVFSRRMQNSMTILGVVVYLQLTTQFFKGLFCVEINGQHVLQVEPSTVCYEGGHLITAIFIWPLLFGYSCGFPVLCFWLVMRTRSLNLWSSSAAKFVYLYRGLKIRFIYFKQFNFVTSFALALQITLSTTSNVTVRLATAFLFFSLNVFLVGVYWPYYKRFQNWLAIAAGLVNALSGLLILTVLSRQVNQDSSKLGDLEGIGLFFLGFGVLTFFVLLIFPARYFANKYFPGVESAEDDELLQAGHYDELAVSRSSKGLGTNHLGAKRQAKQVKTFDTSDAELQRTGSSAFDAPQPSPKSGASTNVDEEVHNARLSPEPSPSNHHQPPSPPMSPHSGLPIHDHNGVQSDEAQLASPSNERAHEADVVVQPSDVEMQVMRPPPLPQPKFDADEYERQNEEGLL